MIFVEYLTGRDRNTGKCNARVKHDTTAVQTMLRCSSYPLLTDLHPPPPLMWPENTEFDILDVQKIDTLSCGLLWA